MELIDFYRALLPESGRFALFHTPTQRHLWVDSIEDLVAKTERVEKHHSWYFALAGFGTDDKGKPRRKQALVTGKRCLYLDLDAGPEKLAKHGPDAVYATNEDAQRAVGEFARATKLVPSFIVHSGGGLHVYFALDRDVTRDGWQPLAEGLGRLAAKHGLKADASCTTDSARVLRPLGALHVNGARVKLLRALPVRYSPEALLRKLPDVEPVLAAPSRAKLNVNDDLQLWEPAPSSALKAAERCAALREIAQLRGDVQEPKWRAMLGLVKFSTEGVDIAHEWSNGHADYDPAETEAKFQRYEGTGPTKCETFGRFSKACEGCEHRGKISTPLQLGRLTVQQVEALPEDKRPSPAPVPDPPKGSPFEGVSFGEGFRAQQGPKGWRLEGRKQVDQETDDGTVRQFVWHVFCEEVFWFESWTSSGQGDDSDSARVVLRWHVNSQGTTNTYVLPTGALAARHDILKTLSEKGITTCGVDAASTTMMHSYTNSQFALARQLAARQAVRTRFGLQFDGLGTDAKFICAQGKYMIYPDGHIEEAVIGKKLEPYRNALTIKALPPSPTGRWGKSTWHSHVIPAAAQQVEFFKRYYGKPGYEIAQLAVMLMMSSPFMLFAADTMLTPGAQLPPAGLTVSLYSSNSGKGKTSMQRAVASCFGDPATLVLSGSQEDATMNYQSGMAAALGTMPYFLDEVTRNGAEEAGALINRIANGSDRRRANRDGSPREVNTWSLVASVSSNLPQRELLSGAQKYSDALQMRLIELTCEFPDLEHGAHVQYEADRDALLVPNYGALGAVLNLAIITAGPDRMRQRVQKAFAEAATLLPGSTQRERFMQRGMACVLACHDVLVATKLALFDRDTLIEQYRNCVREAVDYTASLRRDPDDLLRKMISDLSTQIIVTTQDRNLRNNSAPEMVVNRQQLRAPYVGRRIEQAKVLYLMGDTMRQWAVDNHVSFTELLTFARKNNLLRCIDGSETPTSKRFKITRGTDLSTVYGSCYAIDEARLFGEAAEGDGGNVVPLTRKESGYDDGGRADKRIG
jgi:hypothetical protein